MTGGGWLARLRQGLSRTSARLADGVTGLFGRKLDAATIEALEERLIAADLGPAVAARLAGALGSQRLGKETNENEARTLLAAEVEKILAPVAVPLALDGARKPHVILFCGVNGSGKTTTVGKLAKQLRGRGLKVLLAAGDTFRAAATEQLEVWAERSGAPVVTAAPGADAAALAFSALERAKRESFDVLLIDTAGRLHTKGDLMAELEKIVRVLKKLDAEAPHDCLLVMDATIGQNAINQVTTFRERVNVTGLVLTKLDGSAKGGIVVALAEKFGLPVHAVGVGEGIEDLRPFEARAFARALMGLDLEG